MKKLLFASILGAALLTGCGMQASKPQITSTKTPSQTPITTTSNKTMNPQKAVFTKENYPKVDGSTATIPLSLAFAQKLLSMSSDEAGKFIKHNTTHTAYVNLIDKKADIIFATEPSDEELSLAKLSGVELSVIPIVKEAFVFLLNNKNPVNSLTVKQIQDIYMGKITNFKALGGKNQEIIPYQRVINSGSQTGMEKLVMKDLLMMDAPKDLRPSEMGELIDAIASFDNSEQAIGYSYYYYAKKMYTKDTMKFLSINGIAPSETSVKKGEYPFVTHYYAVMRKGEPQNSSASALLKWILDTEGQKIASEAGYVPLK